MINRDNLVNALKELNAFKNSKNKKYNFYSYDNILDNYNFDVFFNIGSRSNGKSTATQRDIILSNYYWFGTQFVKLCRYKDELKAIHQAGWWTETIIKTLNKWDIDIVYKGNRYYINQREAYLTDGELDTNKFIKEGQILGYVIPLARQQNYKSINYEKVSTIIFDEFAKMTDYGYYVGEVDDFKSLLSTVVRLREDVKVYFIGNVLTPYNVYFNMFGINAMKLKSGHTYTFLDTSVYAEPCIVGLEFGKSVTSKIEDVPRLLRLPDNAQATGLDEYELPVEVIASDDWLLKCLQDSDTFNHFYNVAYKLVTSIDDSKNLKKIGGKYQFKKIEYYYIEDIVNHKIYLVRCKKDEENYGLYITSKLEVPTYKFADEDIRNENPLFNMDKLNGKTVIFGDVELYRILRERGIRL